MKNDALGRVNEPPDRVTDLNLDTGLPQDADPARQTRDPVSSKAILNFPYGIFPRNWRFAATITDIQAGHWGAQSAYFVQVDLSIERYEELENFSFSLWLVPILASGERDPGADVKHYGPQDLEGEVIVVHHNRERGGDAGINAGAGPAGLNASGRGNNTTAFDIKVSGGLKTTCSPDKGRHKMFSQVYENKKSKKGVPNKVRLYAVVVCPDAVALDVSAEVEVVWKKGFVDYVSTLKCPVIGSGFWRVIALPELQEDDEDYKVWKSEKYKQKAANDCVTGLVHTLSAM
ncbi:hypothetical protein N431DRAFT_438377 [Stipitochalara longipes BDJ]|nr:hypothetical protein N431DRAFT_438377 [Stipitochalara longipes BDJ]